MFLIRRVLDWCHQVVSRILLLHEVSRPLIFCPLKSLPTTSAIVKEWSSELLLVLLNGQLKILLVLVLALVDTGSHELILSYFAAVLQGLHRTQLFDSCLAMTIPESRWIIKKDTLVNHFYILSIQRLQVISLLLELGQVALFRSLVGVGHIWLGKQDWLNIIAVIRWHYHSAVTMANLQSWQEAIDLIRLDCKLLLGSGVHGVRLSL